MRPARKGARGERGEGRILYWFRTPPHVKVGRSALDEEAIRLIEEHHPDITFDWPRILKTQPVIVEEPRGQKSDQSRGARQPESRKRKGQQQRAQTEPRSRASREPAGASEPPRETGAGSEREHAEPSEPIEHRELREPTEPREPGEPFEVTSQLEELKQPTMIEAAVQEKGVSEWEAPVEAEPLDRTSEEGEGVFLAPRPVEALVGAEGLERLRARHAALLAAISDGIQDAAKREFLRGEAERLDPDGWVTIDATRAALETYESDYESLRRQLPPRRRRRRRGRRGGKNLGSRSAAQAPRGEHTNSAEHAGPAEPGNGSHEPDDTNGSEEPEPEP